MSSLFDLQEPGFWALTRREDIVYVSQHPELFTSAQGVALDPMPAEFQRIATFFLTMDPPEHTVYRRLISSAFTPRNVRRIEEQIHDNAVKVVDDLVGAGEVDFVDACSARLPMMTIMDMLGVPPADQPAVAKAAEKLFSMSDDEYSTLEERAQDTINEMMLLSSTGVELAKFRRANPGDDLMTSDRQRRGGRPPAHRRGDRRVPDPAVVGRQRHHQADDDARDDGAGGEPGAAGVADGGLRRPDRRCRRGIRALGVSGDAVRPVRHARTPRSPGSTSRPARRSGCSTARRTGTTRRSPTRARSTCNAPRTRIWASAAAVRTSAWATSWPRPNCETCSASC